MEIYTAHTIRDVTQKEWDALVGTDSVEQVHAWYRTVEESGMRKMRYVFLKENRTLTAAACCCVREEQIAGRQAPLVVVGCPLGISKAFFSERTQEIQMLLKGLGQIQKEEKARRISILGLKSSEYSTIKEQARGFTGFPKADNTYLDVGFNDFEDYLDSLSASARRSIEKTLNRAEKRWSIHHVYTNEFSAWKDVAYNLQKHTCEHHDDYGTHLTGTFYEALERNLKDRAELFLLFKGETPIVYGLSLNSDVLSLHKAAGTDPRYRKYQAYFLLYYRGIERAIQKKQKRIYFGATTYEFKEKIGCKRENLFGLTRFGNPALNLLVRSYTVASRLWGGTFQ